MWDYILPFVIDQVPTREPWWGCHSLGSLRTIWGGRPVSTSMVSISLNYFTVFVIVLYRLIGMRSYIVSDYIVSDLIDMQYEYVHAMYMNVNIHYVHMAVPASYTQLPSGH